jgi:uncharacterized Fe-S cluster-containing radical SAM superfamily protein
VNPLPIDVAAHALRVDLAADRRAQVFQNAICSWRCWYCFVDFDLLSGNRQHSEFKSCDELLDLFLGEPGRPRVIDLSGGQPDLVPEWVIWFAQALTRRGLENDYFLWSDDNLSNDYLWRYLTRLQLDSLVGHRNYARVGCFKGFDEESFSFNTRAEPTAFLNQFTLMHRLVEAGFDVYGYATFTGPNSTRIRELMKRFMDLLQERVHPAFPLRTIPLRIRHFTPMGGRLPMAETESALRVQEEAVGAWSDELASRFSASELGKPIFHHALRS